MHVYIVAHPPRKPHDNGGQTAKGCPLERGLHIQPFRCFAPARAVSPGPMAVTAKKPGAPAKKPQAKKKATPQQLTGAKAKNAPAVKPAAGAKRAAARKASVPNFLDPLCAQPAPTVTSSGKALPHTSLVSSDFTVDSSARTLLIVSNVGHAGTVGVILNVKDDGTYAGGLQMLTVPTLAQADSAGGPSASRAMKFSVTVTNCSNALKRGGRVTYLNSSQRLPPREVAAVENFEPIIEAVKSSPYRRRITGDNLGTPQQLIGYPTDMVEYSIFSEHRGTLTSDEFFPYVAGAGTLDNPRMRGMSIVVYVFDKVADPQDYSVTVRTSHYTRWPLTSVPGQSMKQIPTADAAHINRVHDHNEHKANDLMHVAEGGLLATVGPRVAAGARTVGRAALSGLEGLMGAAPAAAEAAAVEAAEMAPLLLL